MNFLTSVSCVFSVACLCLLLGAAPTTQPIKLAPFGDLWTRDDNAGSTTAETLSGKPALHIRHSGAHDWSIAPGGELIAVKPGDLLDLSADVRNDGPGSVSLSFETHDGAGGVVEWLAAQQSVGKTTGFSKLKTRFIVPNSVTQVRPRFTGDGATNVWIADFALSRSGNITDLRKSDLRPELSVENQLLRVGVKTIDGTFTVTDLRNGHIWRQSQAGTDLVVTDASRISPSRIQLQLLRVSSGLPVQVDLQLLDKSPEFTVTLGAPHESELAKPISYPQPFVTAPGSYLVIPMNEGISYPVDDESIPETSLITYGGHGICMSFFGAADQKTGAAYCGIIESADDANIQIRRIAPQTGATPMLAIYPQWESQKHHFGYDRSIRYTFFTEGAHVAIAKRYRQYAKDAGRFKTLTQKRAEVPAVDRLVGAVNIWTWDTDALAMVKDLRAAGIERILWSAATSAQNIKTLNGMGVLTSRYDIYQDLMDPAQFPKLDFIHPDWTTAGWPKDLMRDASGDWIKGWEIGRKDGKGMIPCGVLCDRQAIPYAEKRIGEELKTKPYLSRFIDTTTASPWRECYDPSHPLTRTESREWKMKLLAVVSHEFKLVCGSETGHDASVPFVDYFEGMLSLGPYRHPDAGRKMDEIVDVVPENVAKFQVGEKYRLPLWELVYHDCVVSHWYWGDYNNKLPAIWDKRDQFNALYGTAPMFWITKDYYQQHKARFVQSYNATAPIARATGYSEMTDHRFLTDDREVQQTTFANGVTVIANFRDRAYKLADGREVPAMKTLASGLP